MNYRHIYHAGNFADIVKHITLISILNNLLKKEKPFAVLDAFAGIGLYDLTSEQANKTIESNEGIEKLLRFAEIHSIKAPLLNQYIGLVKDTGENLYPGSPIIISKLLRPADRLISCELHPADYQTLKYLFYKRQNIATHHIDAYNAIKAFLPFKENRGLIFLDPPFEARDEFEKLLKAMDIISKRAANICTAIWYPIKDEKQVKSFYQKAVQLNFPEQLVIEFGLQGDGKAMAKCGVLIANPPFIKNELEEALEALSKKVFVENGASYNCIISK